MISILGKILPTKKKGVKNMATLLCDHCGSSLKLNYQCTTLIGGEGADFIHGVLTCRKCGQKTIFGMTNDAISFYPSKTAYGALSVNTPEDVKDLFVDAELCFYGMGFRGAVAVSRACVEKGLSHKRVTEGTLEQRIEEAKSSDILTDTEYMLAHGSRLAGNAALHKGTTIAPSDIPAVLSAVVSITNHLFQ